MEEKFAALQAFQTKSTFQTNNALKHLFTPTKFESETFFETSTSKINNITEVTLTVTLTTRNLDTKEVAYKIVMSYSGLFDIVINNEENYKKVLRTHCPMILYPYCRAAISSMVNQSPFPSPSIPTIDFFAIHEEQMKNEKK